MEKCNEGALSKTISTLVYLFGWFSYVWAVLMKDVAIILLAFSVTTHVRLPPPLGQLPPIADAPDNYFQAYAFSLSLAFLLVALLVYDPVNSLYQFSVYIATSVTLLARGIRSWDLEQNMINNRKLKTVTVKETMAIPFLMRISPFLFPMWKSYCCTSGSDEVADTDADTATDKEKHSSYLGDGIYCRRYENEVDKQLNNNNNEGYFCLDTISKPSEGPKSKRKVFFYIHGGGWKGGSPTLHSHTVLLMNMAKQGWLVISTNYKKHCWPDHIEGCVSNFAWLEAHADNLQINADMSHVVISGASAGGHLAALLYVKILEARVARVGQKGKSQEKSSSDRVRGDIDIDIAGDRSASSDTSLLDIGIGSVGENSNNASVYRGCNENQERTTGIGIGRPGTVVKKFVFFYPAIDPFDAALHNTVFSIPIPCLRATYGQSLINWFFENIIMLGKKELWYSARPLEQMQELKMLKMSDIDSKGLQWPPCFIAHGELDSIVPIEASHYFLSFLAKHFPTGEGEGQGSPNANTNANTSPNSSTNVVMREEDVFLPMPGLRHSFENTSADHVMKLYGVIMGWLDRND